MANQILFDTLLNSACNVCIDYLSSKIISINTDGWWWCEEIIYNGVCAGA